MICTPRRDVKYVLFVQETMGRGGRQGVVGWVGGWGGGGYSLHAAFLFWVSVAFGQRTLCPKREQGCLLPNFSFSRVRKFLLRALCCRDSAIGNSSQYSPILRKNKM